MNPYIKKYILKLSGLLIVTLLVSGISGCGTGPQEETTQQDDNTVIIEDYKYHPAELTVKAGDTVTWINKDKMKHNARGESFDTGLLATDESGEIVFDSAGTFEYHCTPHPYMTGTVIVEE
jgi:amicyanin